MKRYLWRGMLLGICMAATSARTALRSQMHPLPADRSRQPEAEDPRFAVASVRRAASSATTDGHWSRPDTGSFSAVHVPMRNLLLLAFGVESERIANQPAWVASALYDVEARPEAGISLSRAELKPRLQALLEERFGLRTHRETRMVEGFELMAAHNGLHVQVTDGSNFPGFRVEVHPGVLVGKNWTMAMLAASLTEPAGRVVVDRTGLTGSYDIALHYANSPESDQPPLAAALRSTLGLELRRDKVPVEVIVIDHLDEVPTGN